MSQLVQREGKSLLSFRLNCLLLTSPCVSVGRQTTAPASVSAVAGTTAGIVEQGMLILCPRPSPLLSVHIRCCC